MKIPDDLARTCLSPRTLGLILMPTEKCNFRCTYCYEDFAMGRMPSGVVAGVKALIATRAPTLDDLYLSWFGGEPLLALDIVEDVQRHVQALRREHPRMRVDTNMTTNAWRLTPPVFARLLALGVDDYQISFDGPPEHHDKKRVKANGKPTFERLWKNVVAMREREEKFLIRLRLHVDQENLEAMFPFVDRIRETFRDDPRFAMYLKPLSRYGGPNDEGVALLSSAEDWRRFAELEKRAARGSAPAVPSLPIPAEADGAQVTPSPIGREAGGVLPSLSPIVRDADRASAGPAPGHGEICYASRGNHFVVRSDGRLCKCTIVLDHPRNQVGRLNEDGTVEVSAGAMQPWMRGLWSGKEAELLCPMMGLAQPSGREERRGKSGAGVPGGVEPKEGEVEARGQMVRAP